jgi:chromosome segregation ATPase
MDYFSFKLKVAEEKEKVHEKNLTTLKELQAEYEDQKRILSNEYKIKEERLKKRFGNLEDNTLGKYKEREKELIDKVGRLSDENVNLMRAYDKLERERDCLKETVLKHDKIIKVKEHEFDQILQVRDNNIRELELYIRSISEEANLQITQLSHSILDCNEKITYYKNREHNLSKEVVKLTRRTESEFGDLNSYRGMASTRETIASKQQDEVKYLNRTIKELNERVKQQDLQLNVIKIAKLRQWRRIYI